MLVFKRPLHNNPTPVRAGGKVIGTVPSLATSGR